jgi:hypothetical protein
MRNNESPRQLWSSALHSPYADIAVTLFGGVVGAFLGLVVGWLLAQLFLAVLVLGLSLGIDPPFNGLAWAIYIGVAAIWSGTSIGCWYFLHGKYEGAILTAVLSAVTIGVAFYLVSIRVVVNSDTLALFFLAVAIPIGRVVYRVLLAVRRLWNSHVCH